MVIITEREVFVLLVDLTTGKDVRRYFGLDHGELLVIPHGLMMMLMSYVNSYNIHQVIMVNQNVYGLNI